MKKPKKNIPAASNSAPKKVKEKSPPLSERVKTIEEKITVIYSYLNDHHHKHESHKSRLKKVEGMHATIRKCHTKITGYNTINNKSVGFYNKVILRMREIQKDYNALFNKMGSTITFFERRKPGEDWIPGDPVDETDRTKIDQHEAVTSSQLQKMEEKLDD